jgi:hypothetical protein
VCSDGNDDRHSPLLRKSDNADTRYHGSCDGTERPDPSVYSVRRLVGSTPAMQVGRPARQPVFPVLLVLGLVVVVVVVPPLVNTEKSGTEKVSFWPPVEQISHPSLMAVHVVPAGR